MIDDASNYRPIYGVDILSKIIGRLANMTSPGRSTVPS